MSMPPPGHPAHPGQSYLHAPGGPLYGGSAPRSIRFPESPEREAARQAVAQQQTELGRSIDACATGGDFADLLWKQAPNVILQHAGALDFLASDFGLHKCLGPLRRRRYRERVRFNLSTVESRHGERTDVYVEDCVLLGSRGSVLRVTCGKPLAHSKGWRIVAEFKAEEELPPEIATLIRGRVRGAVGRWGTEATSRSRLR